MSARRTLLCITTVVLTFARAPLMAQGSVLVIDVDPRVELFSIVQHLGGRMNNHLPTRYAREVQAHFAPFKEHRAVQLIRAMVSNDLAWGIAATLGVAVGPLPAMRPLGVLPTELALHPISADTVALYVDAVRDFARVSGFQRFHDGHRSFHQSLAAATRENLGATDYLAEVESYWGARQAAYAIHLSPLMPAGGVGPRVTRPDGTVEVHSILGAAGVRDSVPTFGSPSSLSDLILHEFSHSFVNPVTARNADAVSRWELLMSPVRNRLRLADGLTTWPLTVNELVIRAFTANFTARTRGAVAAERFVHGQRRLGFVYLPRVREWMAEYEADRRRWPTFAAFYPTLIDKFATLATLPPDSLELPFDGDFAMARWVNEEFFFVFIVPTAETDAALQDSLHRLVRQVRDNGYGTSMIIRDVDALDQDLSRFSIWTFGTPDGNLWLKKHRALLPIDLQADRVIAKDTTYLSQSMVAIMALRNPQNRRYPLLVSTGQRIEEVSRAHWVWQTNYAIMDGGKLVTAGLWPVKTDERWGFATSASPP